eukprot:UC1_evm1s1135
MIPGYTGFVPKAKFYTGQSFAKQRQRGIVAHEMEQKFLRDQRRDIMTRTAARRAEAPRVPIPGVAPMRPQTAPALYTPRVKLSQTVGVMPGYTGHVRFREHLQTGREWGDMTRLSAQSLRAQERPDQAATPREYVQQPDR